MSLLYRYKEDSYPKLDTFLELGEYHLFRSNLISEFRFGKTDKFDVSN